MGKKRWVLAALLVAVACGRSERRPHDVVVVPPEDEPGGDTAGGEGSLPNGTAGGGEHPVAGAGGAALGGTSGTSGSGSGGASGTAGEAGASGGAECADTPDVVLAAPLATTSLTVVAPFDVALGQGFLGDPDDLARGHALSLGCVIGQETNASLALGVSDVEVTGGGTPSLGTMQPQTLRFQPGFLAEAVVAPFNASLAEAAPRSLWGYADTTVRLWGYFLTSEQRSQVANCGDGFVRSAAPARAMAVAFKLTFLSAEERDIFSDCFARGPGDITKLGDPEKLSRYLVRHEATLAIHVLSAAGPGPTIQQLLDDTQCSTANLPACAATLDALEELRSGLVATPEDTVPLAELAPAWGIFDFRLGAYTLLPD